MGWSFATGFLVAFPVVYKAGEIDSIVLPLGILGFALGGAVAGVLTALSLQSRSIPRFRRFATASVVGAGFALTLAAVAYPAALIHYFGGHLVGNLLAPAWGLGLSIGKGLGGAWGGAVIGSVAVVALRRVRRSPWVC